MRTEKLPLYSKEGLIGHAIIPAEFSLLLLLMRWCVNADGYPVSRSRGRLEYLHKVVFGLYYGKLPINRDVDHIDRNKRNALPTNLRMVSRSVNIANSGKRVTNSSGFKGVYYDKANKKWRASIQVNYKMINLGRYLNKEDAARAVNEAYREHFPDVEPPNKEV